MLPMLTFLALVVLLAVAALAGRHLKARLETGQLGDTALELWRRAWPATRLTWPQLERRIFRRLCGTVSSGISGQVLVPSHLVVSLSEADDAVIGDARHAIATNLSLALKKRAVDKGWTLTSEPVVEIVCDPDVYDGAPRVAASFRDTRGGGTATLVAAPAATRVEGPPPADGGTRIEDGGTTRMEGSGLSWALVGPDGRQIPLPASRDRFTIGRAPASDLCFADDIVSSAHVALVRRGDGWRAEDGGSRNGTYVDGRRVAPGPESALALAAGSELRLGRSGPAFALACTTAVAPGPPPAWRPPAAPVADADPTQVATSAA